MASGQRLGPQRRMGLCPTIPEGDCWVQTLQEVKRSKVNSLDSGSKKQASVVGGFPRAAPFPLPVTPRGNRLVGVHAHPLAWLPGRNF